MKEVKNEIIDFEKKGNLIRFYLGRNGEQWGDDWDDIPYEYNAEGVYDEFVRGYCDIVINFDCEVNELCETIDGLNSPYCKDDMKKREVPCIKITCTVGREQHCYSIYFGDKIEGILKIEHCHLVKLVYEGEEK